MRGEEGGPHWLISLCEMRSILFWTMTMGMSPHSSSTFFLHFLTACREERSTVEKAITQAWGWLVVVVVLALVLVVLVLAVVVVVVVRMGVW